MAVKRHIWFVKSLWSWSISISPFCFDTTSSEVCIFGWINMLLLTWPFGDDCHFRSLVCFPSLLRAIIRLNGRLGCIRYGWWIPYAFWHVKGADGFPHRRGHTYSYSSITSFAICLATRNVFFTWFVPIRTTMSSTKLNGLVFLKV